MSQSFNTLKEVGALHIANGGELRVGDSGDGPTIAFDGTSTLNLDGGVANDTFRVGETTQMDVQMDGATDMLWDASAGSLTNGGFLGMFTPNAAIETIAAGTGGAISVTTALTDISTDAGGDAFTLADGTVIGQVKCIVESTDGGGAATITPANYADGTTITFDDANDLVVLVWNGSAWRTILNVGGTIA